MWKQHESNRGNPSQAVTQRGEMAGGALGGSPGPRFRAATSVQLSLLRANREQQPVICKSLLCLESGQVLPSSFLSTLKKEKCLKSD